MEKTILSDKINESLIKHLSTHTDRIDLILLHPKSFDKLINEISNIGNFIPPDNMFNFKYQGIRVYRTMDIKENDIIIS